MPNNTRIQPAYLPEGDPEAMNQTSLLYPGMLGSRLTIKQPGPLGAPGAEDYRDKTYQLVQVDSAATVAPYRSAVAWWSDKTKYLVTTSPTALGRGRIAGAFQNAIGLGNYGYIQTGGPASIKFIDAVVAGNVTAVGNFVIPSATAGKADVIAAGTAATYPTLGVTAGALNTGDNTAVVDLDVPETP